MSYPTRLILGVLALLAMSAVQGRLAGQTLSLRSVQLTELQGTEKTRFVAAHNTVRKAVQVEPIAWSSELSQSALDWLTEEKERVIEEARAGWADRKTAMPDHRNDGKYGENIAGWAGTRVPGAERAVTFWLTEKAAFDKLNADGSFKFGDQDNETETDAEGKERPVIVGHYTAMVWRTTTHLGAAKLVFQLADDRGAARTYVAIFCLYSPRGNIRGEKPF